MRIRSTVAKSLGFSLTADEGGRLVFIADGDAVNAETDCDLSQLFVMPGFIDTHNHGAVGVDVNTATIDGFIEVGRFLASVGVTSWVPTLVPDEDANYQRVAAEIGEVLRLQDEMPVARIVGIHYEGIFANEKMCGALRPEFFRAFSGSELDALPEIPGLAHIVTYAPEIAGGINLTKALVARGWVPSIGHTNAGADVLSAAFDAGARRFTHLFNAMTGVHHRDLGVAGFALSCDDAECEIIADGIHVRSEILRLAARVKSAAKLCLVSDSVAPTGLGDGEFELWDERITVESGRTRNERGSIAGSVITVADAVKCYGNLGVSAADLALMASGNAARTLGISNEVGSLAAGKRADLVALDDEWNVKFVMIGGRVVFDEIS